MPINPNLNDYYWIKPGQQVTAKSGGVVMTVDFIDRRRSSKRNEHTNKFKYRTRGVKCSWIDSTGRPHSKMFHTHDLQPYPDVALEREIGKQHGSAAPGAVA